MMQAACPRLVDALELDRRILEAHALLARAERDLALLLAELADKKHFLDLGYANMGQYAQVKLQLEPRKTRGLVRIGRALPDLPALDQAFGSGVLCWTKARELLAVITPETETEWVELACQSTSRELERAVAGHRPGEPPSGEGAKEAGPVRLSFSMEPVEAEQVRTLLATLGAAAGVSQEEVGAGALLAQVATRMLDELGSTEAPTGERFRIVIEHCPQCGQTSTPEAEVSETHLRQACCDAEILDLRTGPTRGHVSRSDASRLPSRRTSYGHAWHRGPPGARRGPSGSPPARSRSPAANGDCGGPLWHTRAHEPREEGSCQGRMSSFVLG
jgi:hypothetical protein